MFEDEVTAIVPLQKVVSSQRELKFTGITYVVSLEKRLNSDLPQSNDSRN